ncbi:transcriptional regulator family: Fungal Specific TF [Penicillium hispanicum]|uniref:transcriptional regulator family: Fungal Specific TF n=1 Tax=Penicillium hispanicum TaxID=1080232 RepID=UPI002541E30B|nr:transcriptional regulator family: Fungal Specific TF [Penicillium hispanicum]KAJ5579942.1 transcriptional regulator family: Fungal Specific TF [Penicillium hispanicum]
MYGDSERWLYLLAHNQPGDGEDGPTIQDLLRPELETEMHTQGMQQAPSLGSFHGSDIALEAAHDTPKTTSASAVSPRPANSPSTPDQYSCSGSPPRVDSLEFINGAFSFYIGPTGVSDIHILSHQPYDEQNVALPKVNGLRYRILSARPQNDREAHDFIQPTVFGITDNSLLANAEPKLDPEASDNAWSRLWKMMDSTAAWHLVQLYARHVDPYYPIISQHQIPSSPDELSNMPLPLLTAICATALPFIMYDEALFTLLLHPPQSQELYHLCWLSLSQELHAPTLATLQACLLLQQRLPTNMYLSDTAFAWSLMSTSLAVGQTIGLHRDPISWKSVPAWERRLRRRLWWGLYVMEKWVALARGMPSHLSDDNFDVSPLTSEDIEDTLSQSLDTKAHITHLTTLTAILSDIQNTFYTVRAIRRTSNDLQYSLDAAKSLRAKLRDWRNDLPICLSLKGGVASSGAIPNGHDLDGNGALYLSYIVTHVVLLRALLRPLDQWPALALKFPDKGEGIYESAKAVVKGALLCVKEFVEFLEKLTGAQWNGFWHSCQYLTTPRPFSSSAHSYTDDPGSRPNFAIAGSFMVHLLQTIAPKDLPSHQRSTSCAHFTFDEEYSELQGWIQRWRWVTRISANGAAGVKGLTNLGFIKVESLMGNNI